MKLSLVLSLASCAPCLAQTAAYPSALATSQNLKVGVNGVSTLLTADISSATTSISVSNCDGIVAYTLVTIDQEIMDATGCSGTTMVVDYRGFDGTTAVAHSAGAQIQAFVDAWHHNSLAAEVEAIESTLGTNLANVSVPVTLNCGTTNTCANTSIASGALKIVIGTTAALNAASPAVATVTGISPAFTSTNSYVCTVTAQGVAAPTHVFVVSNLSSSSFKVTGPNGATDLVNFICLGN